MSMSDQKADRASELRKEIAESASEVLYARTDAYGLRGLGNDG